MGLSELDDASLLLDEKLLHFMSQLEDLEEKRASLNALIEQGWLSLSKARYSMGNKQVSSLQYASEIEPLVCVHAKSLDNGKVKFSTNKVTQTSDDSKPVEDVGPQETGVRRRNKKFQNTDEKQESDKATCGVPDKSPKARKCDRNLQQDPLKWFGILVPQSLKQAQSSFKQVIELSMEIASLQTEIINTKQELSRDMKQRHKIQETCVDKVDN